MSRRWRIETALAALMRERGISTLDELITILVMGKEPSLSQQVVEALLNNETYFFRDRAPFDLLQRYALPELAKRRQTKKRLRIWSAGCSTGQEAYSLAMLFAEEPEKWLGWTVDILGTDVSTACVDRARHGIYSQFEVQRGLGINQMIRWFEECADGWRAVEPLRKPVRFQVHNLLEPAPHPGGFDVVLCRNVMLYLSPDKKAQAFDRIAGAMAEDGWLMLGAGETVIGQTTKLGADVNARGLYRQIGDGSQVEKRGGPDRTTGFGGLTRTAVAHAPLRRMDGIIDLPSPNFDERALPVSMIVLHYTGMPDAQSALDRLTSPEARVSSHYLVDEDGTVYRLVDETKRAWHAGSRAGAESPTSIRRVSGSRSSTRATSSATATFPTSRSRR